MPITIKLGLLAGGTIFLGLPVARWRSLSDKTRAFLNAVSTGILVFLLVEIMGNAVEWIEDLFQSASAGYPKMGDALTFSGLLIAGLAIGLLGMIFFENYFIRSGKDNPSAPQKSHRLAMMIAIGIGIHNLTEGLAIAQAYSFGAGQNLALFLAVGFALHNATEGFGIAAPLSGGGASWSFLFLAGLVGGGPTLLGAYIGSFFQSDILRYLSFGLASGAILYIVGELLHIGRQMKGEAIVEIGLLVGFTMAFAAEMLIAFAGGTS